MAMYWIRGYAPRFGVISSRLDSSGTREMFLPSAFDGCIFAGCQLKWNHEGLPMARAADGSLLLVPRALGLAFQARVGFAVAERASRSNGVSLCFQCKPSRVERRGNNLRVVHAVERLLDVTLIEKPSRAAYPSLRQWLEILPAKPVEYGSARPRLFV